ncbi:serine/threonine protein kinase [Archangium violaceum]|uniref:serine/threonine-protein kinase n=1 Tax=Archangium violaceum TaxID=83451 RepID=UPI001951868D|nr:serine/threonine-protein kinase [Archangium violaceum]QRN97346.1 serine/threonine protein kinase [Archangium violaceum]
MENLKRSKPEQQVALPEREGAPHPDDCPGCPHCVGDALLEQELLRAQAKMSESGLEPTRVVGPPSPLPTPAEAPPPAPEALPRGTSVGRYLVLERLGAGGMGEVYAAFDPQLNRKVAIKLLLPGGEGLDRSEARLRLMREAQSMARLSHPNVLPVYDIGEHGDQVFIALELVEGCTLRRWLKEEKSRHWREVVEVLTRAGRGLAAAHAVGLVHRDFKPDNVLVGRDGRVLVFDFGLACDQGTANPQAPAPVDLAEILRAEPTASRDSGSISGIRTREPLETPVTRAGLIMGTPGYMAPEQYRQEPVTAQADQFSFCATLYYALYGEHAFEGSGAAWLARATLEGRLRPPPRDSRVPGWLRRVVLKGLSLHPRERYVSMGALLDALQDDPRTRLRRDVFVAVAAAFLLAVVAGAVGQWHQRQGLCQESAAKLDGVWDAPRQQAVEKAFLATGQPYAATTWAGVKRELDAYASDWVERQREACVATRLRGQASEELLTARTACLERRRAELKALTDVLTEANVTVVERAVEAARGLSELGPCAEVEPAAAHVKPDPQLEPRVEGLRASLARARALRISGQYPAGLSVAAPVVAEARTLGYPPLLAEALLELGQQQADFGNPDAEHTLKEAVWRADAVRLDEVRTEALVALTQLVAYDAARVHDGHDWFHQARALLVRTRRQGRILAELESSHGLVYAAQGDVAAAEASHRNALAVLEQVSPEENPEKAVVLRRLGNALSAQGRYEEALLVYQRAHADFRKALGDEHPRVGSSLVNIGTTLTALGRHGEALEPLRQGVAIVARTLPVKHPFRSQALNALGFALWRDGDTKQALDVLRRAVATAEHTRGPEHPEVAQPCNTLGLVLLDAGEPKQALEAFARALRIREHALGAHHPELAGPLTGQGEALMKLGRTAEALAPLERALSLRTTHAVPPVELAETRFALARALWASHRDTARARQLALVAQSALEQPGGEHLRAEIQDWLASHAPRE